MQRILTLYTKMPLRHKLELRSSNVQTDEIFEAALASHGEFENETGIVSLDSAREIAGSVLCDF